MAMTPREARTVEFTEDRRGYAQSEVHEYQERVAEALRLYETEVGRLKARLEQSEARVTQLEEAEDAVRRTFAAAATTKREMIAEAESEAALVRREADDAAARLRTAAAEETEAQRSAAQAEATRLVAEARRTADETRSAAAEEVRQLERRLLQLRTSITDLEERLRDFAGRAMDELAVAGGMIDLETTELDEIEHLAPEPATAAEEGGGIEAPASEAPATSAAEVVEEAPAAGVPASAGPMPSGAGPIPPGPEVEPEPTPVAEPAGPAVGIPVRSSHEALDPEDEPESSFYERRLAGLRRRIESAGSE